MDLAKSGGMFHNAHAKWLDLSVQALRKCSSKNSGVSFVYEKCEYKDLRWRWYSISCNYHLNTEGPLVSLSSAIQSLAVT